jgi:hypothetical protein
MKGRSMDSVKEVDINNSRSVNLVGAIISGLCVGFILAWSRASGEESYAPQLVRIMLLAIGSYGVVALLLIKWNNISALIPNWILIAVLGSLVCFLSINLIPDLEYIWTFRNSAVVGTASSLIQEEIVRLILNTVIDALIAGAIMMLIRYVDRAIKTKSQRSIVA